MQLWLNSVVHGETLTICWSYGVPFYVAHMKHFRDAYHDFAVGAVLAGQADAHPLVVPVSLARLPTRLSLLVS